MKYLFFLFFFLVLFPKLVFAHPGRTDASGCHYCTSCSFYGDLYKWDGHLYEYYHCHNNSNYSPPQPQNTEPLVIPTFKEQEIYLPPTSSPTQNTQNWPTLAPLPTIDNSWKEELKVKEEEKTLKK
jgi:hypothetical protein